MTASRATSFLVGVLLVGTAASLAIADPPIRELPDPKLTPGVVASTEIAEVCGIEDGLTYSQRHRATTREMKLAVLREYGEKPQFGGEIDHLYPLCIGGADDIKNLWAEPAVGTWSYHDKDRLEAEACRQVCRHHKMPLAEAQALFVPDWRKGYCKMFLEDRRC